MFLVLSLVEDYVTGPSENCPGFLAKKESKKLKMLVIFSNDE